MFSNNKPNPICLKCHNYDLDIFSSMASHENIGRCKFKKPDIFGNLISSHINDCPLFVPKGITQSLQTATGKSSPNKWEFYQNSWKMGRWSFFGIVAGAFLVLSAQSNFVYIFIGGLFFLIGICMLTDLISNWNKPELIFDDRGIHSRKKSIVWSEFKNFKLTKTSSSGGLSYVIEFYGSSSEDDIYVNISFLKGNQELVKQQILTILHDKTGTGGWS